MKKISLLLFGAMFVLVVKAQVYTKGEWKVDSVVTTISDGKFLSKEVCKYNDKGLLEEIDGHEMQNGSISTTKSIHTYNEQGVTATQEIFLQMGNEWTSLSKSEVIEYDLSNGMPRVIESIGPQELNPTGENVKTKTEITKWHGYQFEEEEVYMWLGGTWTHGSSLRATYDANDLMTKLVTTISMLGFEYSTEVDYEYDAHGNVTKETTTAAGTVTTTTYANEYDANDNLKKVTMDNQGEIKVVNYYWSRGGSTAISSVKNTKNASRWFDMSGRRLADKPTKHGVYIRDGKKFIVK